MIQAESDPQRRDEYLQKLMELPNQRWAEIIGQARQSVEFLKAQEVVRAVLNILQTNTSVASALGQAFLSQISLIYLDMLNVYRYSSSAHSLFCFVQLHGLDVMCLACLALCRMYSELISTSIAEGGPYASRTSYVKLLR
jgi:exportin-1